MTVKLLPEQHLEFLRFKGGYTGSSESTLVKMPHCWCSYGFIVWTKSSKDSDQPAEMDLHCFQKRV